MIFLQRIVKQYDPFSVFPNHTNTYIKNLQEKHKGLTFGQLSGLFPRFVQRYGACPYKMEKNLGFFLESAEKHRNFASSKETNDKDNKKYKH